MFFCPLVTSCLFVRFSSSPLLVKSALLWCFSTAQTRICDTSTVYALPWAITSKARIDQSTRLPPTTFSELVSHFLALVTPYFYRFKHLRQAGPDWWLDHQNRLLTLFLGNVSIFHFSPLRWLGFNEAACTWWTTGVEPSFYSILLIL